MGEEQFERGVPPGGVHFGAKLGEDFADGGGPLEHAVIDEHGGEGGGHGLGQRTDVPGVVELDGRRIAELSHSRSRTLDHLPCPHGRRGQAGHPVALAN